MRGKEPTVVLVWKHLLDYLVDFTLFETLCLNAEGEG